MIDKDEVKHIASLARIGLNEEEIKKFSKDLSGILVWISEIKKADLKDNSAMSHVTGLSNRTRDDVAREFESREEIVELFPEKKNGYDKVKSVL